MTSVRENLVQEMYAWLDGRSVPNFADFNMKDYLRGRWTTTSSADYLERSVKTRHDFIKEFGFCIPCSEALDACAIYAPLVEVGAGSGYWTKLLQNRNVDCIATDPAILYPTKQYPVPNGKFVPTLPLHGKTAARRFRDRNVLMVWPSYGGTWARQCLKAMSIGRSILAVTEGASGCCAEDGFFEVLDQCFVSEGEVELPVFWGLHDRMEIWRKVRPWRRITNKGE